MINVDDRARTRIMKLFLSCHGNACCWGQDLTDNKFPTINAGKLFWYPYSCQPEVW